MRVCLQHAPAFGLVWPGKTPPWVQKWRRKTQVTFAGRVFRMPLLRENRTGRFCATYAPWMEHCTVAQGKSWGRIALWTHPHLPRLSCCVAGVMGLTILPHLLHLHRRSLRDFGLLFPHARRRFHLLLVLQHLLQHQFLPLHLLLRCRNLLIHHKL